MTIQEELREAIVMKLTVLVPQMVRSYMDNDEIMEQQDCEMVTQSILSFLHLNGVVIKVDKPLPLPPLAMFATGVIKLSKEDLLKAGYTAWESLIEEVK